MAFFGSNQRRLQEGTFTSSIYTLIKENKHQEAIVHLNIEVQVR